MISSAEIVSNIVLLVGEEHVNTRILLSLTFTLPLLYPRVDFRTRSGMSYSLQPFLPALSILLLVVVLVQVVDLVPCADEAEVDSPEHAEMHVVGNGPHGQIACDGEDTPEPDPHDGPLPDCLCHIAFVSTSQVPEVVKPDVTPIPYDPSSESAFPDSLGPPEPIPLV